MKVTRLGPRASGRRLPEELHKIRISIWRRRRQSAKPWCARLLWCMCGAACSEELLCRKRMVLLRAAAAAGRQVLTGLVDHFGARLTVSP